MSIVTNMYMKARNALVALLPTKSHSQINQRYLSEAQIVDSVYDRLTPADIDTLRSTVKEDLIMFHHSTGKAIRNNYRLWYHPLADNHIGNPDGEYHPDNWSMRIIEKVHQRVLDKYGPSEQVSRIRLSLPDMFASKSPREG